MFAKIKYWLPLTIASLALAGCDKEKVQEAVNVGVEQAAEVVDQTVETVRQEANLAGSMELSTNPPLAAKACYATLLVTDGARPNVLRLASYKSTELERFPSMIIEAHVDQTALASLSGQTVQAKIYAQSAEDGPLWSTPTGSLATVSITGVDDTSLTCECAGAPLVSSETGEQTTVSGKFVALFE